MSVFTQFTSGTGGSVPAFIQTFTSSGTFTAPISGWYGFYVVGAGGGGGASSGTAYNSVPNLYVGCQGGSAGGSAVKFAYVASGTSIVVTIGTGGAGANLAQANQTNSGSAGNVTTVVGGNVNITCNAGAGGSGTLGNNTANAKSGGNATGGDYNWSGGGQSAINAVGNVNGVVYGGAAPGVFGTGISPTGVSGGGTGSADGMAYGYVNYGGSTNVTNFATNINSIVAPPIIFGIQMNSKPASANDNSGIGAGGAYVGNNNGAGSVVGLVGGLLGGGGVGYGSAQNGYGIGTGGAGGRGGGGGSGICRTYNAASWAYGGAGGAGFVQIGFLGQ